MNTQTQNAKWTVWDKDVLAARRAAAKPTPKIESVTPLVNFIHDGVILTAKTAGVEKAFELQKRSGTYYLTESKGYTIEWWKASSELLEETLKAEREATAKLEADYASALNDLARLASAAITDGNLDDHQDMNPVNLHERLALARKEIVSLVQDMEGQRAALNNLQVQYDGLQREYDDLHIELQQLRGMRQLEQDHAPSTGPQKEHSDDLTLAYLREWWKTLGDDERAAQPPLIQTLVKPWHKRTKEWDGVILAVNKRGQRIGITPFEASEAATAKAGRRNVAKGQGAIQRTPPDPAA